MRGMLLGSVNIEGDVEKTTTAIYLGSALATEGKKATLIDLDSKGTAMDWAESAAEAGAPLAFEVSIAIPRQLERITPSLLLISLPAVELMFYCKASVMYIAVENSHSLSRWWSVVTWVSHSGYIRR